MELGRFNAGTLDGVDEFQLRQVNYSTLMPGAVKAWHVHYNQEDVWFVPPQDRLLVGLVDLRSGSDTEGEHMRFILGGGRARRLVIPRGVAHGVANLGTVSATLLYFVNQQFNAQDPDEHRLPWDYYGAEFWDMTKG